MFLSLQREITGLIDNVIELVYFMRGSISYEEMMRRTPGERERISQFINKRLEKEAKKMYPNY